VGTLGTGKTYTAVHDIFGDIAAGRQVFTNFTVQMPEMFRWRRHEYRSADAPAVRSVRSWEEFLELEDGHVVLDEGQLWAPSYDPKCLSGPARFKLSHMRKDGMTLTLVTQHEDRAARMLRDLCTEIIRMRLMRFPFKGFVANHFEPEIARRQGAKPLQTRKFSFSPTVGAAYRTLEAAGFPALTDPYEVGVVEELSRRRNAGEKLAGTLAWVQSELDEGTSDRALTWLAREAYSKGKGGGAATPRRLNPVAVSTGGNSGRVSGIRGGRGDGVAYVRRGDGVGALDGRGQGQSAGGGPVRGSGGGGSAGEGSSSAVRASQLPSAAGDLDVQQGA
jgi:hypothetical protein